MFDMSANALIEETGINPGARADWRQALRVESVPIELPGFAVIAASFSITAGLSSGSTQRISASIVAEDGVHQRAHRPAHGGWPIRDNLPTSAVGVAVILHLVRHLNGGAAASVRFRVASYKEAASELTDAARFADPQVRGLIYM